MSGVSTCAMPRGRLLQANGAACCRQSERSLASLGMTEALRSPPRHPWCGEGRFLLLKRRLSAPRCGSALARRWVKGGHLVALLARDQRRLAALEQELPAAIADELFHVAHQDRTAWSFNVEVRPYGESW